MIGQFLLPWLPFVTTETFHRKHKCVLLLCTALPAPSFSSSTPSPLLFPFPSSFLPCPSLSFLPHPPLSLFPALPHSFLYPFSPSPHLPHKSHSLKSLNLPGCRYVKRPAKQSNKPSHTSNYRMIVCSRTNPHTRPIIE